MDQRQILINHEGGVEHNISNPKSILASSFEQVVAKAIPVLDALQFKLGELSGCLNAECRVLLSDGLGPRTRADDQISIQGLGMELSDNISHYVKRRKVCPAVERRSG